MQKLYAILFVSISDSKLFRHLNIRFSTLTFSVQLTLGQLIIGNWQLIIYEEKTKEITTLSVDLHVVTSLYFSVQYLIGLKSRSAL